ncbi:FAD-binding oxidoreductase [Aspergillus stella-maris]|uniref:FAD-binding oxidoreductase n=1 Tax=Aspergillus stella-maris TaxID=1810926 RepID=UPI003CCDE730
MIKQAVVLCTATVWSLLAHATPILNVSAVCQRFVNVTGQSTGVLLPDKADYLDTASENWSQTSQLSPLCILEPETSDHVAQALKLLTEADLPFAVRGGGHMPVTGAANIDRGVLISLERMQTMELVNDGAVAQVGPGLRWDAVFEWISTYGLAVVGGRYGPVGVPGFLLGGGINFFGSQYGWAANMISNMEVVLANGTIVYANHTSHTDLFWALKGGSSNYGIVTRFDLSTFPLTEWYGGQVSFDTAYTAEFLDAVAAYVSPGGGSEDRGAHQNPTFEINVSTGERSIYGVFTHLDPNAAPASFANFSAIPTVSDSRGTRSTLANLTADTSLDAYGDRTSRQLFRTTTLKASGRAVALTQSVFEETVESMREELQSVSGLIVRSNHQAITQGWLEAAREAGGDAMDIDPSEVYLLGAQWDNAADDEVVREFSRRCTRIIERRAREEGIYHPFRFLNDASGDQNPFAGYGSELTRSRMREIRREYDPQCIFQRLMPGGFKLGC